MREYLWGLTLTCISAAIVRSAVEGNASKKYIDMLCSICVVCALVLPIFPLIPYIDEYDVEAFFDENGMAVAESDSVEIYNGYLHSVSVEQAELSLELGLSDELGLKVEEIDVQLILDTAEEELVVTETVVYLQGSAINKDPAVIKNYIEGKTGVNCRIIY